MPSTAIEDKRKIFEVSPDGSRFIDTAAEILRRTQVGPKGPIDTLENVWPQGREFLLTNLTTEALSPEGLRLLGFKSPEPVELKTALGGFIENSKNRLIEAKTNGSAVEIANVERAIAREVREIVSGIPYERSVDYPAAMASKRALNCVGAQYLGCHILDQIGLTYLMAEVPQHSVHMLVTTSDNKVYFQDMLNPDTDVEMTNNNIEHGIVADLTDLVISSEEDGVITFTINAPELDEMKGQVLPVQGKQFVCRAYSGEIGYSLQLLHNLSLKFHKPEWVMSFSKIGLSISSQYAPLEVRLGNATEILEGMNEAKLHYEKALQLEPHVAANHARLGRLHYDLGEYDKALEYLDDASKLTPNDGTLWNSRGRVFQKMGDDTNALVAYERAVEIDPRLVQSRINLMKMYLTRGDDQKTREIAEASLSQELYSEGSAIQLAEYFEKIMPDLADSAYKKAIEMSGDDKSYVQVRYADYLARSGNIDAATALFEQAISSQPNDIYTYWKYSLTLRQIGRTSEAEQLISRALEAPYDNHRKLIERDMLDIFEDMKEFPEIYETVVFPTQDGLFRSFARTLMDNGDLVNAEKACRKAIDVNPYDAFHHSQLAQILLKMNETDGAISSLYRTVELQPGMIMFANDLAKELIKLGRTDEAGGVLIRSLGNFSKDELFASSSLSRAGRMLISAGELDAAYTAFELSLELNNSNSAQALIDGEKLQKIGNLSLAEKAYEKALEIEPSYANAARDLCQLLIDQNRKDEAISIIRQILDSDNNSEILGNDDNLYKIAKICSSLGEDELKDKSFEKAIATSRNGFAIKIYAKELEQINPSLAETAYRKALSIHPDNLEIIFDTAKFLFAQGKIDEAKELVYNAPVASDRTSELFYREKLEALKTKLTN